MLSLVASDIHHDQQSLKVSRMGVKDLRFLFLIEAFDFIKDIRDIRVNESKIVHIQMVVKRKITIQHKMKNLFNAI